RRSDMQHGRPTRLRVRARGQIRKSSIQLPQALVEEPLGPNVLELARRVDTERDELGRAILCSLNVDDAHLVGPQCARRWFRNLLAIVFDTDNGVGRLRVRLANPA